MRDYRKLFEKFSAYPVFFFICLFISGCSGFKEGFNQGFKSSFVLGCMEPYESNAHQIAISRTQFLAYCECALDEMLENGDVQLSRLIPVRTERIINSCFERELSP